MTLFKTSIVFLSICCCSLTIVEGQQQIITIAIDTSQIEQTIQNFGASGAWFSEPIGRYWKKKTKTKMAELLFSKAFDADGNPKGIGLSAWRFNIGGGSFEQGDSSGIKDKWHRVETFLKTDGTYDWSKQKGYLWFTHQAKSYGVENLIAFSNTPPVQFTQNHLGYKTIKDYKTNLKEDKFEDYAMFLSQVLQHFRKKDLTFQYISPVNEPQWDWSHPYMEGTQEGTPWSNKDIAKITRLVSEKLQSENSSTKILLPEAAMLQYLYEKHGNNGSQIQNFWNKDSANFIGNNANIMLAAAGHSYFSDGDDSARIAIRKEVKRITEQNNTHFWQSEYSMLGDNYKENKKGPISEIDCALFLAKVIHDDLVYGNAEAWHWWNSWEPGPADHDTRYYLLALQPTQDFHSGDFKITKNLWALGHYSRFVRPGMVRLHATISDGLTDAERAQNLMISIYRDVLKHKNVAVIINYSSSEKEFKFNGNIEKINSQAKCYITTANSEDNMRNVSQSLITNGNVKISPRSILTIEWN